MNRLHELSNEELTQWEMARFESGYEKYQRSHLNRYGTVDTMEELIDAKNILALVHDRAERTWLTDAKKWEVQIHVELLIKQLVFLQMALKGFDRVLPDEVCSDEKGCDRVWWSK